MTSWMDSLPKLWKYSGTTNLGEPRTGWEMHQVSHKPLPMLRFWSWQPHGEDIENRTETKEEMLIPQFSSNFPLRAGSLKGSLLTTETINLTGMFNPIYNLLAFFPSLFLVL